MSRMAFEELAVRPADRVLEVGFGGGELSGMLLAAGAEVTGIDVSLAMAARARSRFREHVEAGRASFEVGIAQALPFGTGHFDKAVSVNTIYFWSDLDPVFAGFARAVRPGGLLAICFQTADAVRSWPGYRYGFVAHEEEVVAQAMIASGFDRLDTRRGADRRLGEFVCLKGERR